MKQQKTPQNKTATPAPPTQSLDIIKTVTIPDISSTIANAKFAQAQAQLEVTHICYCTDPDCDCGPCQQCYDKGHGKHYCHNRGHFNHLK